MSRDELRDAGAAEHEHFFELPLRERRFFSCSLHFDQLACFGGDEIEIDADSFVLCVIQVDHGSAIENARADCPDKAPHR